jgi:hypothetical protein
MEHKAKFSGVVHTEIAGIENSTEYLAFLRIGACEKGSKAITRRA